MNAFLDTNIFVYSVDGREPVKQAVARKLLRQLRETDHSVISTQILQEFYNAARKKVHLSPADAKAMLCEFADHAEVVRNDRAIIENAIDIGVAVNISFWDSLLIAAAESSHCDILYTEDLNDGQTIRGVKIVNPFKA